MRAFKFIVNAFVLFVLLPTAIVAVFGIVLSPLQTSARAVEPRTAFTVSDVMWDEASILAAEPHAASVPNDAMGEESDELDVLFESVHDAEVASDPGLALSAGGISGGSSDEFDDPIVETAWLQLHSEEGSEFEVPGYPSNQSLLADEGAEIASQNYYSSNQLRTQGVIYDGGFRYTWYSQRVLPGGGLSIEGRHVSDEGYVVDSQGRVVVASSDFPWGTELAIPFGCGRAIVLDTGCDSGTLDIYTDF